MENSKLVQVLKSLEKKEILELRKFLKSPFFNHREDVIDLYELLLKQFKKKRSWPTKDKIYDLLFPSQVYSDAKFHLLFSYLFKLTEQYLSTKEFLQDEIGIKLQLVQSYRHRNLHSHFRQVIRGLKLSLEEQAVQDGDYYEKYRQVYWEEYQMKVAAEPSSSNLYLEELMKITDISFFAQKMRQICLLKSYRSIYKVAHPMDEQISFVSFVEEHDLIDIPAIGIYFHGYYFLEELDGEFHFKKFKALLFQKGSVFSLSENRELYLMAVNFCIKQVNGGNQSYFQELFQLYQRALELNVLLENGKLSRFTYYNAVATGIKNQAFDWAKKIIYQYRDFLEEEYQESAFYINLAHIEFEQENFSEALDLINNVNFTDILVNLAAKTITLKIYYHHQEYDLLEAHLNAMNNFIRRSRVLGYHKENYLKIIRYTKKLIALNTYDKEAVLVLKKAIEKEDKLTEKKWLLEQIGKY